MHPTLTDADIWVIQARRRDDVADADRSRLVRSSTTRPLPNLARRSLALVWNAARIAIDGYARLGSSRLQPLRLGDGSSHRPAPSSSGESVATTRFATPAKTGTKRPHPTLAFLERALGDASGTLTASPDADRLEERARHLTSEYWSDAVWTTGCVPAPAFRRVLADLAPHLLDAIEPRAMTVPIADPDLVEEATYRVRSAFAAA